MKDWFRKWFKHSKSDPWLVQTPMVRTADQMQEFFDWKGSATAQEQLGELRRAYEFHGLGIETPFGFKVLKSQGAEGLFFMLPPHWTNTEASHLYDWICWLPLGYGYVEAHSEQKTNWINPLAGQREFRYLKPAKSVNIGQEIPQLFGNIIAERMLIQGKTQWIKMVSQFYQGRPYTQVKPFSDFTDLIFNVEMGLNS
jgi:hypothetical protein